MSVNLNDVLDRVKAVIADVPPMPGVKISADIDFETDNLVAGVSKDAGLVFTLRMTRRYLASNDADAAAQQVAEWLAGCSL